MYDEKRIDILSRFICLIVFLLIISFSDNFVCLSLLSIFFFVFAKSDKSNFIILLYAILMFSFSMYYADKFLFFLRISLVIDYIYYFLYNACFTNIIDKNTYKVVITTVKRSTSKLRNKYYDIISKYNSSRLNPILCSNTSLSKDEIDGISKRLEEKNNYDVNNKVMMNSFRFNNSYSVSKKVINKRNILDMNNLSYILLHFGLLLFAMVVGSCVF